jgi:hypothetical protein
MDRESTLKLYHELFSYMSEAKVVAVYVEDKEYKDVFVTSASMRVVSTVEEADIVMISSEKVLNIVMTHKLNDHTVLLSTQYRYLKRFNHIIGAFYWKKSRFQLLFLKNRLDAQNIKLPTEYKKYIVEKL